MGWACIWPSGIHSKERRSKIRRSPDCQQARRKRRAALRTANSPDGSGEPRSGLPTVQTEAESRAPDCRQSRRKRRAALRIADSPDETRSRRAALPTSQEKKDRPYSCLIRPAGNKIFTILPSSGLTASRNLPFLQSPSCRQRRMRHSCSSRSVGKEELHYSWLPTSQTEEE